MEEPREHHQQRYSLLPAVSREGRDLERRAVMCCLLESSCLVSGLCCVRSCWLPLAPEPWLLFNILPAPLMLCLAPVGLQLTAGNWSQFSVFISQCFDWRQIQFRRIRAGGNNYQVSLCLLRFGRRKWREPPECCRGTWPVEARGGGDRGQRNRLNLRASVGITVEISASPALSF